MAETGQDSAGVYSKIVAMAWHDPAFKAKLLADPNAILEEAGIRVPPGVRVKVVENSASVFHLVLPPKPTSELSDAALDRVVGGSSVDVKTGNAIQEQMDDLRRVLDSLGKG